MITTGKHKATIVGAGLVEDKGGQVQPYIRFKTESGDEISWFGNLKSEKSQELAVKSLVTAGFIGNDFEDLKKPSELVFQKQDLSITVEEETYNGKKSMKIKFINKEKAKTPFAGQAPKMSQIFAKFKAEMGVTAKVEDEIPF